MRCWKFGFPFAYPLFWARAFAKETYIIVDDTDRSIRYTGLWDHFTGGATASEAGPYDNTTTLTRYAGATASYSFNGVGISVFGTIIPPVSSNSTMSTYSIDGQSASTRYSAPRNVTNWEYRVPFYTSPALDDGPHTLLITNIFDGTEYRLDYLNVTSLLATTWSTSVVLVTSTTFVIASPSTSPDPTNSATVQTSSIHAGIIAAIVISASILLGAILYAIWRCKKKSSRKLVPIASRDSSGSGISMAPVSQREQLNLVIPNGNPVSPPSATRMESPNLQFSHMFHSSGSQAGSSMTEIVASPTSLAPPSELGVSSDGVSSFFYVPPSNASGRMWSRSSSKHGMNSLVSENINGSTPNSPSSERTVQRSGGGSRPPKKTLRLVDAPDDSSEDDAT